MGRNSLCTIGALLIISVLFGCQSYQVDQTTITVTISLEDSQQELELPAGSSVQIALDVAGVTLNQLDQISPPVYTVLEDDGKITITRVREEYETRQVEIPFERKELSNESMPEGEERIVQSGKNGVIERTFRHVFENNVLVSTSIVSETIVITPVPEIMMVGIQNPFTTISIPGKLVYLTSGNAWVMETSTANRRPLVTNGDLDGRVFSLSPDGLWLLYSRKSNRPSDQEINNLWLVSLLNPAANPINLHVANVVHFADWQPGKEYVITYSTVEPRASAPGWQANNDLFSVSFDAENLKIGSPVQILDSTSGGIYGWWGTSFTWAPDGSKLAYSRPDGIGLVDFQNKTLIPMVEITPFNTYSDWAWIPGLAWGNTSSELYYVTHSPPPGLSDSEESPYFDLQTYSLSAGISTTLTTQVGMFAYPSLSPTREIDGENAYDIVYLQAIFPLQSSTSRYRLIIMDRDGSEQNAIFPAESQTGIKPQYHWGVWEPKNQSESLALLYDGNLWIINIINGNTQQVTGDGLTTQLDWK